MKQSNRITVRFDYKEQPRSEPEGMMPPALPHYDGQHYDDRLMQPTSQSETFAAPHPWDRPYQEDIGALEQLIRESAGETNASREAAPDSPEEIAEAAEPLLERRAVEWPSPSRGDHVDRYDAAIRALGRSSWLNVFFSVAGALATGALFGYLLLTLLTGDSPQWLAGAERGDLEWAANADRQPEAKEVIGEQLSAMAKEGAETADSGVSVINLTGLDYSYSLLQYGVFQTAEGRDEALRQLASKGLASASLSDSDGYRIFAALAVDSKKADIVRSALPELELYGKSVKLQGSASFPFGAEAETAAAFFKGTNELIRTWSDLIVAQLEQPSLSPLGDASAVAWKEKHKQWSDSATKMAGGMAGYEGDGEFAALNKAIERAATAMRQYDERPQAKPLWSAQSALMDAVLTQKRWFETMSAL